MSVRWSERQQAMLREMGVTLWLPPVPAEAALPEAATPEPVPAEAPVPSPAPAPAPPPVRMSRPAAVPTAPNPPSVPRPLAARPSGVAAMDWPALREAVAGCEACGLCRSRRNTVFGVGHEQAQWMIIGEAPGEQEDRQGEPFVGKAGQLLDNMLRAVGLTRAEAGPEQQVYIANVLKCRPPMNRNPEPQEVAQCEPFLKRQVELVAPKLILAMGRFAVQSILQTGEPIGRLRGRVHAYHGVPVVVTYHPAYLLRNPADKARSWDDLCLAREVLSGGATPA
ncbi:uracil-DNA glycosylase [Sphaerotilus natans]|uniref:uracil-DNA glycosylase n=1 Tax=Sphaerotilus natans TaxID=34103 RepID=UPI00406C1205